MEATQGHLRLLSQKEAVTRLGVARITLLRARQAACIRVFRIGTRVLYSEEQLAAFLKACERNRHEDQDVVTTRKESITWEEEKTTESAARKDQFHCLK